MRVRELLDVPGLGLRLLTDVAGMEALSRFDFERLLQPAARELD